ncbi:MAG: tetratricopeptide repeat protein [Candidatus Omnitrophica bacterium]|nr:tetratricopeptide repeat protein [Candidatus Omnitrophota bacterium]
MNPEHKKYILENITKKSIRELASDLGLKERKVRKFVETEKQKKIPADFKEEAKAPARPFDKIIVLLSVALIIILGLAVYANSLNGKFVYDDETLIMKNAFIKDWSILPKVFTEDTGKGAGERYFFYRPLQIISYAVDYHAWRLNVVGYHLTNVILHILVTLCIYWFINILFGDKIISIITAIFFVTHPIHTTVVSYISTRAESLYLLFMLISFIFYIKSSKTKGIIPYVIMLSSYSLSLLSKESALIFPVLILLYHYTFREKIRLREFLSLTGAAFIYILLRMTVLKYLITGAAPNAPLIQRIPGFFAAITTYIRLLILPLGLHIEYGKPLFTFTDPKVISGLLILGAMIFCAFKTLKANGFIFFSLSWFIITLLPVSNLYPLNAYMSENWLYLPSIGFFLALGGSLGAFYKKGKFRILALILTACLLVFYSYLTIRQNETWREPVAFYERTIKYAPDSSKTYYNLGFTLYRMGEKQKSIPMYKKAIELKPDFVDAYNNLASVYYDMNMKEEAISLYKKAIELNPNYAEAYNNLAVMYDDKGREEETITMYKKAIELKPNYVDAYNNLASAYYNMGRKKEAGIMYEKAIELNPNNPDAYNNLGTIYDDMGKKEKAIAMYKKAIEINPNYAYAYYNLGITYIKAGRREDAAAAFKKALEINPDNEDARHNLRIIETGLK